MTSDPLRAAKESSSAHRKGPPDRMEPKIREGLGKIPSGKLT